jgi:hypothetical protein
LIEVDRIDLFNYISIREGKMKKLRNVIIILSAFLMLLFLSQCSKTPTAPETPLSESVSNKVSSSTTQGFLQLILKDKPVDNALNIFVTINKIRVHQASPSNFIVLSEEEKEFDLLALKNNPQPILEAEMEPGLYNQIRMAVISGRIVFEDGEYELQIPSSEIKIPVVFEIKEKGTVQIILDFDAEKSIKVIRAGKSEKYILRPVIKVESVRYQ